MPERRFLKSYKSTYKKRRINHFEPRQRLLIVCEGEKTEPNYFKKFPIPSDCVIEVNGIGANTVSLVKEAIRLRDQADYNYDQVWCVFDRDSFPVNNFNAALQMAKAKRIKVAYSNEAFELWYLLHYCYFNTGLSRKDYKVRLTHYLGHKYQKNSKTIYDEIYPHQNDAIRYAKKLLSLYTPNPAKDNPSTTVHVLVEKLKRIF